MEKAFKSTKFTFVAPFNKQREILSGQRDFTSRANTRDKTGSDCKLAITAPDILIIKYHLPATSGHRCHSFLATRSNLAKHSVSSLVSQIGSIEVTGEGN